MNYIEGNKAAWEEAFEHKRPGWGEENHIRLQNEKLPFFYEDASAELRRMDFAGKSIAQFCCNNGRELLSLMQLGAQTGIGFDIAENIIKQAQDTAQKANIPNCTFVACNILDIPAQYVNCFDFILITIGALGWFRDLTLFFKKVSECLKPGGTVFIHDFHPLMNLLPMPGEPEFDEHDLRKIVYPYFRSEPWLGNKGMSYMTKPYESKTFTSFSYTFSSLVNAMSDVGILMVKLKEFDYDIGLSDVYDAKDLPLSYLLIARKTE